MKKMYCRFKGFGLDLNSITELLTITSILSIGIYYTITQLLKSVFKQRLSRIRQCIIFSYVWALVIMFIWSIGRQNIVLPLRDKFSFFHVRSSPAPCTGGNKINHVAKNEFNKIDYKPI